MFVERKREICKYFVIQQANTKYTFGIIVDCVLKCVENRAGGALVNLK